MRSQQALIVAELMNCTEQHYRCNSVTRRADVRVFALEPSDERPEGKDTIKKAAKALKHLIAFRHFDVALVDLDLAKLSDKERAVLTFRSERLNVSPLYLINAAVLDLKQPKGLTEKDEYRAYVTACVQARKASLSQVVRCRDGSFMPFSETDMEIVITSS